MELQKVLTLPKCTFTKKGLKIEDGISKTEWHSIGGVLKTMEGCVQFWIGDWLRFGENKWGEMYKEAEEKTGIEYQTLADYKYTADKIDFSSRNENLSFTHHKAVASLVPEKQEKFLALAEKKELSVRDLREVIKAEKRGDEKRKKMPVPNNMYRILYVDPPWAYNDKCEDGAVQSGGADKHYPTMTIKELCEMEIPKTENDAVLFLWTTSPLLEESFEVINAWGFKYKASFVWDKIKHNMGHYNSVRHEFLLICTKGSCVPDNKKLIDSVQSIERTKHSEKPIEFKNIIDDLYEKGNRIELFARGKNKDNWDSWGNEV